MCRLWSRTVGGKGRGRFHFRFIIITHQFSQSTHKKERKRKKAGIFLTLPWGRNRGKSKRKIRWSFAASAKKMNRNGPGKVLFSPPGVLSLPETDDDGDDDDPRLCCLSWVEVVIFWSLNCCPQQADAKGWGGVGGFGAAAAKKKVSPFDPRRGDLCLLTKANPSWKVAVAPYQHRGAGFNRAENCDLLIAPYKSEIYGVLVV